MSLLEVIVCAAIVAILVATLAPVVNRARMSGKEAATRSNLRQIFLGMSLYRDANDNKVEFGRAEDMGLPPYVAVTDAYLAVVNSKQVWRSPCCCQPQVPTGAPNYEPRKIDYVEWLHTEEYWELYVTKYQNEAVLFADFHCNDRSLNVYEPLEDKLRAVGVRLSGKIELRARQVPMSDVVGYWNF
jgi:type II secretory pathway pseudopilin PulG